MTDYMKCGDGPWCERCSHKGDVEPPHVRYLNKNALGRCDFFRERSEAAAKDTARREPAGNTPT